MIGRLNTKNSTYTEGAGMGDTLNYIHKGYESAGMAHIVDINKSVNEKVDVLGNNKAVVLFSPLFDINKFPFDDKLELALLKNMQTGLSNIVLTSKPGVVNLMSILVLFR